MSKSILKTRKNECYLCKMLYDDDSWKKTDEHHIFFGTSNRKNSEHYGLKVFLCDAHHEHSEEAVHVNHEMSLMLQQTAQRVFEKQYSRELFMQVFGKNYLWEEE